MRKIKSWQGVEWGGKRYTSFGEELTDADTDKPVCCPLAGFAPCNPDCVAFTVYDGREDHTVTHTYPVEVVCRAMGNVMLIGVVESA